MLRCTTLSDANHIREITANFTPYALNVTRDDMNKAVASLPALKHLQSAYTRNWRFAFGFASIVVLSCGGEYPLGFAAASEARDPETFAAFLERTAARARDVEALKQRLARGERAWPELRALLESLGAELRGKMASVKG